MADNDRSTLERLRESVRNGEPLTIGPDQSVQVGQQAQGIRVKPHEWGKH
ncbi:MAG: hypothetical protein HY814_11070 [Candidatus Riflebacteria bacterium]|nr:hypothetical protein [Candidatus Riflebacteria bacterium]